MASQLKIASKIASKQHLAWRRNWILLRKQCQHTWACTVYDASIRKTNHLAWHGFVELHRKQCQHMRTCTIQDAIVQKTSKSPCMASQLKIAWRIASKKHLAWRRNWILLRKQCQHTWTCTVHDAIIRKTNYTSIDPDSKNQLLCYQCKEKMPPAQP